MLKTILVALDGSDQAPCVIRSLDELQIQPTTKIILTHVIADVESDMEMEVNRPHPSEEFLYQDAQKQLEAYQAELPCESEREIVTGDPAVEIVRLAHIYHTDLIVIGTRGFKGLQRILHGSVSDQVVAEAPCSVLVVKSE